MTYARIPLIEIFDLPNRIMRLRPGLTHKDLLKRARAAGFSHRPIVYQIEDVVFKEGFNFFIKVI